VFSGPFHFPANASTLDAPPVATGLPDGDAPGAVAGLTDAAGAGVAAGLFGAGGSHAAATTTIATRTIQNPKSKIRNGVGLLMFVFFICLGQSRTCMTD